MDDDHGFTLIELLVTVALLGTAVVAVMTGLVTSISSTTYDGKISTNDTALRNYANTIKQQMVASCTAGNTTFTTSITPTAPTGFSLSPSVGTSEPCPNAHQQPTSLTISVSTGSGSGADGAATDTTQVWLWLP
jgi:prepilin-type N-terminal cleavage/methylation domain-containing protein